MQKARYLRLRESLGRGTCMLCFMKIFKVYFLCVISLFALVACSSNTSTVDPLMQRFEQLDTQIRSTIQHEDVPAAFALLRTAVEDQPALADVCHGLSHVIGEAAFERYGMEDAFRYEEDVCGSGYIHGVVEAFLADVPDLEKALKTVCAPTALKCFHGIGHGLMDRSQNDLPGSITLCDSFPERRQKIQCAEGVFMENYEVDQNSHPTKYLNPEDPFFPCRGQDTVYEGVCALYAPRYYLKQHPRKYEDAITWCGTVPEGPRDACIKGVGDAAMKQNIEHPEFVAKLCATLTGDQRRFCIEGMSSYYIIHHASAAKGREMCGTLPLQDQPSCLRMVADSEEFYPE